MALAPSDASAGADPTGGVMGGADPSAAPANPSSSSDDVVVTIVKTDDGSYMVYAGDEPDVGSGDSSEDDADAMGGAGAAPDSGAGASASQGTPADSVGAALKAALDILNSDKSSEGAPGNADDQFSAGFSASKSPTPASGGKSKY